MVKCKRNIPFPSSRSGGAANSRRSMPPLEKFLFVTTTSLCLCNWDFRETAADGAVMAAASSRASIQRFLLWMIVMVCLLRLESSRWTNGKVSSRVLARGLEGSFLSFALLAQKLLSCCNWSRAWVVLSLLGEIQRKKQNVRGFVWWLIISQPRRTDRCTLLIFLVRTEKYRDSNTTITQSVQQLLTNHNKFRSDASQPMPNLPASTFPVTFCPNEPLQKSLKITSSRETVLPKQARFVVDDARFGHPRSRGNAKDGCLVCWAGPLSAVVSIIARTNHDDWGRAYGVWKSFAMILGTMRGEKMGLFVVDAKSTRRASLHWWNKEDVRTVVAILAQTCQDCLRARNAFRAFCKHIKFALHDKAQPIVEWHCAKWTLRNRQTLVSVEVTCTIGVRDKILRSVAVRYPAKNKVQLINIF